jgi:ergothioneine biosynthesis protein EgtB
VIPPVIDAAAGGAAERYQAVRDHTERLAAPLRPEDQVVQSMPDVSPTKWHRAHVTWFFETFVLAEHAAGYEPYHPAYRYLFNSYYEQVGDQYPRPRRGLVTRPDVGEIGDYRRSVDDAMRRLLDRAADADADADADERWSLIAPLVELGLHHEQQHQELLLMDIKHVLSCNPLDPVYDDHGPHPSSHASSHLSSHPSSHLEYAGYDGGLVEIGHDGAGFCFDNETPRHSAWIDPFRLANRLVTCGEWIEFVDAGGYTTAPLWLSDGWYAAQDGGWSAPLYWRREPDGSWTEFTLAGRRPVDPGAPVCHVSHYEADAFARWAGARLPTEHEWEHAAAKPAAGLEGAGEVWEWTASAYLPYPGFRPAPGAVGEYNGKFMSGQMVLRGGACVTPPGHARATYRNFFPPASRWMFGGLRLATDA